MRTCGHQYFTKGADCKKLQEVHRLLESYGFARSTVNQGLFNYSMEAKRFSLVISDRPDGEFYIDLSDNNERFAPDKSHLEFRIIAHFLQVAEVRQLTNGAREAMSESKFQALLDCYRKIE